MSNAADHTHCHRCGRTLRSAIACTRKYGARCWGIVRQAARALNDRLATFTARQVDQALELIEDAAVIPGAVVGLFHCVSTDGTEIYDTTVDSCPCPAGKPCYHQAAVLLMTA